jgi:hypothetical protein
MSMADEEQRLIPQTGAAALWRVDFVLDALDQESLEQTCTVHVWTCIWCSMSPPICGSCRPVTPPCPASGRVHVCACRSRVHSMDAA